MVLFSSIKARLQMDLTGCPNGGHFPIVICQSGSYRLSGNITVPDANTTAIVIFTDDVTLDLNTKYGEIR
jgi:hypothetical protein